MDNTDYWACTLYYFTFGTVIGGVIIIVGLVGNGMTIKIMGADRHKSSTIHTMYHLAIADTVVLITYFFIYPPIGLKKLIWGPATTTISSNYDLISVCYILVVEQTFNQISCLLVMIVTWQRYVSVCLPIKAKELCTSRIVNALTAAAYIFSILFYSPNFFMYSIKVLPGFVLRSTSTSLATNQAFQITHAAVPTPLLNYLLPVIKFCLVYMSLKIMKDMREQSQLVNTQNSTRRERMKRELTISSIGIVVMFIICQSFNPARRVLMWVYDPYQYATHCGNVLQFWAFFPGVASIVNSATNFVIYIIFASGFRSRVRNLICPSPNAVVPIIHTKTSSNTKESST